MTEKDKNKYFKIGLTVFLTVSACILFFFAVYRLDDILDVIKDIIHSAEPIIIGMILAYLCMPVKNIIELPAKKGLLRLGMKEEKAKKLALGVSILGAVVFLFVIIGIMIAILVPAVTSSVIALIEATPGYINSFITWIEESDIEKNSWIIMISEYITVVITKLQVWAENEMLPFLQQYIAQITSGVYSVLRTLLNFIIGIIVMVYIMSIKETLKGQAKKIIYAVFPAKKGNLIIDIFRKSNQIFGGFITGKIIDSAIIGVLCYVGCMIIRIPSALLVSVIVGVTNIIPFFGPFIGAIPSILIVLIQSPIHALYLAIFILALQQVDGNIIGPKILGDTTGLSPFWVLFSILIAGGLFGFFGMLLGVPVFAVIYYICQITLKYRMESKKLSTHTEDYVELIAITGENKEMVYKSSTKSAEETEEKTGENKE